MEISKKIDDSTSEIVDLMLDSGFYEAEPGDFVKELKEILTKYFNPTQEQSENDRRQDQVKQINDVFTTLSGGGRTTISGENSTKRTRTNYNPYRSRNVRSEGGPASTSSPSTKRTDSDK